MKKTVHTKKNPTKRAWNSLLIVVIIIVVIGVAALFIAKSQETSLTQQLAPSSLEPSLLSLSPAEGCELDDAGTTYVCNIGVRNTSGYEMAWVGYVGGISGATLSNNGYGVIPAEQSGFVTISVPVAYCETNPQGIGEITIVDKEHSINQGEISFHCSD